MHSLFKEDMNLKDIVEQKTNIKNILGTIFVDINVEEIKNIEKLRTYMGDLSKLKSVFIQITIAFGTLLGNHRIQLNGIFILEMKKSANLS